MRPVKRLATILLQPRNKRVIVIAVLALTTLAFVQFFVKHPQYLSQLKHTNPWLLAALIAINAISVGVLAMMYNACVQLCGKRLGVTENILLTSYSSIINFFGPLQSGPGVRAVYLRTRHHIRLRDYMRATLLYYAMFASMSALFLVAGSLVWWQSVLAVLSVIGVSYAVISLFTRRDKSNESSTFQLRSGPIITLLIMTFLQIALLALAYFIELRIVNPHIGLGQAISYTGAANFSLFVSLTPDAIGFRESFLYLSRHLHHVSTANILTANVIDRAAYVVFLALLFVFVLALHAKDRLQLSRKK